MKYSISQIPAGLLALAVVMALLLGLAPLASAEGTGAVEAGVDRALGGSASDKQTAPPTAEVEPSSSTEAAAPPSGEVVASPEETSSQPPPSPKPTPTPAGSDPTSTDLGSSARPDPVANFASRTSGLTKELRQDAPEAVAPIADAAGSASQVAGGGKVVGDIPAPAQRTLREVGHVVVETGTTVASKVAPLSNVLAPLGKTTDLIAPLAAEDPLTTAVDTGPLPSGHAESSPGSPVDAAFPLGRVEIADDLLTPHLAGPGGIEPFPLPWAAASSGDAIAGGGQSPQAAGTAGVLFAGGGGALAGSNPASPDGGGAPWPAESPPAAAPGLGGSSFVPIVALLALLALAAPAIFRRVREVPDLLAPLPFVCALERPG